MSKTDEIIESIPSGQKYTVVSGTAAHAVAFKKRVEELRPDIADNGQFVTLAKSKNPSFEPQGEVVLDEEGIAQVNADHQMALVAEAAHAEEIAAKSRADFEMRLAEASLTGENEA